MISPIEHDCAGGLVVAPATVETVMALATRYGNALACSATDTRELRDALRAEVSRLSAAPVQEPSTLRSLLIRVYEKACAGEIGVLEVQRTCGGGCYGFWDEIKRALDATAPQPAPAGQAQDGWYLQDTRSYVGNDVLFWAKGGNGYTTDVSKAEVYTREAAFAQAAMRGTDRAWPKAYIDGKTRPAVDMQYIKHAEAIAALSPDTQVKPGNTNEQGA